VRIFIAFKLPIAVVDALDKLQTALKRAGLKLAWVHPGNIHLTLKFLGDVKAEDLLRIERALGDVSARHAAFALTARGLGVFPTVKKARVLWSGIHGDVLALKKLHADLDLTLERIGFAPETRSFRGHLTLGRMKGKTEARTLAATVSEFGSFSSSSFVVDRLILFQSDLKPGGAEYTELAGVDLAGAPDRKYRP